MQRALERHNAGEAYVVPVILRPVDWQGAPFASLQALPPEGQPIVLWENRDEAFAYVAEGVRKIVGEIHRASPGKRPDPLPLSLPRRPIPQVPLQPSGTLKDKDRQEALKRVQWVVNQFLKQLLADTVFIHLGLSERPDALENPWRLVYREMNRLAQSLPPETAILQVYDQANGELLILGEPGSGKTTLLWKLADDLLTRAFADSIHPIPVVVQLSTWADKRLPLAQWLVEELSLLYKIPRKLSQTWIEQNRLLLLLDGLDEMGLKHRAACIRVLNDYRKEHGLAPLVVCSRSAEYFAQTERIQLSSAVVIQPLTQRQIDSYVARVGERGSAMSRALRSDSVLRELATTPLMLNLLLFTYQDSSAWEGAADVSPQERRNQIFTRYIELVLVQRRAAQTAYSPQQTKKWLVWLARQLASHSQTAFYLERMQPDWLDGSRLRVLFRPLVWVGIALASSAFSTVLYGLSGGAIALLSDGLTSFVGAWEFALIVGGLLGGVTGVLVSQVRREIRPAESVSWSWHDFWQHFAHTGLGAGSLAGLLATIFIGLLRGLIAALLVSLPLAVIFGLLYQTVQDLPQTSSSRGSGARRLSWPVQGLLDSLCVGLITLGLLAWPRVTLFTSFFTITFSVLSLIVTVDPCAGYVRRVTHDEIADAIG